MEKESDTDIRLNLLIDATPDATMKIIMDPIAGDYISGKGTGNIRTEFYNKGDVKMFGSYRISQGVYKFSLQEVIRKDFIIKDGSTITFNGAPLNATLDIQAGYLVNSASLNDLVPDAGNYVNQTNIKVNCLMALTGQLTSPDIKMSLELPKRTRRSTGVGTELYPYGRADEHADTLPSGYRQVLYSGECGCHRQLQHDVERTLIHPFRTTEQCTLADLSTAITGTSAQTSVPEKKAGRTWSSRQCFPGNC